MKYLYAILSWGIVALGAVHMMATLRLQHAFNISAMVFQRRDCLGADRHS